MVSLTIHLSKAGVSCGVKEVHHISATSPPDEGAAISPCLADCSSPLLKGVGTVFSDARVGNSVGMKASRRPGDKVHLCVKCNFPIAVYGRLEPCEHVYCLMCAALDATCFLCNKRILRIQKMDVLEGIFICGAPGCLRSFLARPEFDWHVVEFHSQFLQPGPEKNSSIKGSCVSSSLEVQDPRLQAVQQHLDVTPACQSSGSVQVIFLKKEDALHQQFKSIQQDSHGLLAQLVPEHPVMYQSQEQSFVNNITHACLDNGRNLDPPCRDQKHQQKCKEWDFQTPWQQEEDTEHERAYQGQRQREIRVEVGLNHAIMKRVNELQCPPPSSHPPPKELKELKRDRDSLQAQLAQPPISFSPPTYPFPSSSKVFNVQQNTVSCLPQFEPLLGLCHHGMVIHSPTEYREKTMQLRHLVPSNSVLQGEGLITPSKEDMYVQKSLLGPAVDGGRGNPTRPMSMNPQGHYRQKRPSQPRYHDDVSHPMSLTTMGVPRFCEGHPLPPPCSPPMRVQNDVHSGPALPGLGETAMDYSWGSEKVCISGGIPRGHVFPGWMPSPNI